MTATTYYGPYDVTDYVTWQNALAAGVTAGNRLSVVKYYDKVIFIEIATS